MSRKSFSASHFSVFFLVLCCSVQVWGVPARPGVITLTQPDGTKFDAELRGDEFYHYYETLDGLKIVQNSATGFWEYARLSPDGQLLPSGQAVGIAIPQKPVLEVDREAYLEGVRKLVAANKQRFSPGPTKPTNPAGTIRGLVLLVYFSDSSPTFTYGQSVFQSLMNNVGYSSYNAHGSLRDYYNEVSYGNLIINCTVEGWFALPQNYAYYGANTGPGGTDANPQGLVTDAINQANSTVDFSKYDANSDGWIDFFMVIHEGQGEETGGPANAMWSQMGSLGSAMTPDGMNVQDYTICPEEVDGSGNLGTIGVMIHEGGHFFGTPDLYDTGYNSQGIGDWGSMGTGSWRSATGNGSKPVHFCGWTKIALGWVTPTDISGSVGNQALPALDQSATVLRIFVDEYEDGEYFTVTNRYQRNTGVESTGFDQYLHGSGAVIMHIDDYMPGNTDKTHKKVDVEEADGLAQLDATPPPPPTPPNRGDAGDVFTSPTGSFDDSSNPDAKDYSSSNTGIVVTDFQGAGSASMTVDIAPRSSYPGYSIGYDIFGVNRLRTGSWGSSPDYGCVRFTTASSGSTHKVKRVKAYFPYNGTTNYTVEVHDVLPDPVWTGSGWAQPTPRAAETGSIAGPGDAEVTFSSPVSYSASTDFYIEVEYGYGGGSGNPIPLSDDYTDDNRSYANTDPGTYTYGSVSSLWGDYDINIRADVDTTVSVYLWELY